MPGCCDPHRYDAVFTSRFAHRAAVRYRRRGLRGVSRRVADEVVRRGVAGATVLEVGAGSGELHVDLLRRGASAATALELASSYEEDAATLLAEYHLEDRVTRRHADLATDAGAAEAADVVVLNRVVCCYPDGVGLLRAAADHARRLLVVSYPRDHPLVRLVVALENLWCRLTGKSYRGYLHPPGQMHRTLAASGLAVAVVSQGMIWQIAVGVRPA